MGVEFPALVTGWLVNYYVLLFTQQEDKDAYQHAY